MKFLYTYILNIIIQFVLHTAPFKGLWFIEGAEAPYE
jgi:hypothetical protein